ncbi:fad-containing monooxygenase [Diplodia corticola]|uniref:Fad-containing monooxygenase n=1 Tax=Diplodia corticola TaxID=236234 RepID=A0A1J9S5T6_9PEZI|nr:fad-containing monooxygenase [Diplodia corticola]OJD40315.1 fad-containing monooxygenase [Diplodia corticola]
MEKTAADANIQSAKIRFKCRVNGQSWGSAQKTWSLDSTVNQTAEETLRSRFIVLATGYYDHDELLQARIPGIDSFTGPFVQPGLWPTDLDCNGKDGVIIGLGVTVIDVLPAMASEAKHITMLQRSLSYVIPIPMEYCFETFARAWIPLGLQQKLIRLESVITPVPFSKFCMPRKLMKKTILSLLGKDASLSPDVNPTNSPLEQ